MAFIIQRGEIPVKKYQLIDAAGARLESELRLALKKRQKNIVVPYHEGLLDEAEMLSDVLREGEADIFLMVPSGVSGRVGGGLYDDISAFMSARLSPEDGDIIDDRALPVAQAQPQHPSMPTMSSMPSMPMMAPMMAPPKPSMARHKAFGAARHAKAAKAESPVLMDFDAALDDDDLEARLKKMYTDTFSKHLQQLINKKGMKNSEVYAAANISKQYFSKLMKDKVKPSKEKVLALAIGLRLNLDETADLLRVAGYAFSPVSQTDIIVEYFIEKEDYNMIKIDIVLFDYGLEPLAASC